MPHSCYNVRRINRPLTNSVGSLLECCIDALPIGAYPAAIIACIPAARHNAALSGAPETTRTSDLPLRRRLLYPTELPGHIARAGVILAQRSRGVMHG